MSGITVVAGFLFGVSIAYLASAFLDSRKELPLPAGPKGFPILGNVQDLPPRGTLEAHHWLSHKDRYGSISSITVLGQTIVIINDASLALDIMASAKVSSRPRQVFAGEMVGWDQTLGLSPYNSRCRTFRKNMSRIIGSKPAAAQFNPLQDEAVSRFLVQLLERPDDLVHHVRQATGAVILKMAYGYNKRAQEEIDRVMGYDSTDSDMRLPTLADRERMPYVKATVKEVIRWHPVAPMGLPHTCTEDVTVNNYRIPAGAIVLANVWPFTHDPTVHDSPIDFIPERCFSDSPSPDLKTFVFGSGRRLCPRRILTENSIFLLVAQALAVSDVAKPGDGSKLEARFDPGVVSHPAPFRVAIRPRSSCHEALIREVERTCPFSKGHGEILEGLG